MIVELDVFSGRPNPRWHLDEDQAAEVAELLRRLAPAPTGRVEPPALGYRGFLYSLEGATWRAWAGFVIADDRVLMDPARSTERRLLESLPAEYADLRARVAAEIES